MVSRISALNGWKENDEHVQERSVVKMRHWPAHTPFVGFELGDFLFSDEGVDREEGTPKWIRFACPRGKGECTVPLFPQTTSKGATWRWNGDRENPTLTPSINCLAFNPENPAELYGGCGWHGFITNGEIT